MRKKSWNLFNDLRTLFFFISILVAFLIKTKRNKIKIKKNISFELITKFFIIWICIITMHKLQDTHFDFVSYLNGISTFVGY